MAFKIHGGYVHQWLLAKLVEWYICVQIKYQLMGAYSVGVGTGPADVASWVQVYETGCWTWWLFSLVQQVSFDVIRHRNRTSIQNRTFMPNWS